MLFKSTKLQELIEFPEHSAEIKYVYDRFNKQYIEYSFDVNVNLITAMSLDALSLQVEVYRKKPVPPDMGRKIVSPAIWSKSTKRLEKISRSHLQERTESMIAGRKVDLSEFISNDLTNVIKPFATQFSGLTSITRVQQNSLSSQSQVVKLSNPFIAAQQSAYKPVVQGIATPSGMTNKKNTNTPLNSSVLQGIKTLPPSSKPFSKSLLSVKVDPASITSTSQQGFSKSFASKTLTTKIADFIFTPPRSLPPISIFRVTPEKKKITFSLSIDRSSLGNVNSFYLNLELENSRGVKVAEASKTISHATILNSFLTPSVAPTLQAEYAKPGLVSIRIGSPPESRRTKKCKRIKVFRRLSSHDGPSTSPGSGWAEVFDSVIQDSNDFIFRDAIATSRPIIYRAVCYGENFKPSEKFSSTVVLPLAQFKVQQTGALTALASLSTPGANSWATILVKDIPHDVISIMVKRYNESFGSINDRKASKGPGFVYIGSTPAEQVMSVAEVDDDSTVSFIDRTARIGNNYRYSPIGITKAGKEVSGASCILEIPQSPNRAQVSMTVTSPYLVSKNSSDTSVKMELSGEFTDFGFSEVRRSLAKAQQAGLFSADILEDRSKFESLIGFLVERENSKTGESESFGTYASGEFLDDASTRAKKNIKSLTPGIEYVYKVTALLNSPETLFTSLKRNEVDIKTLLPFSRKISKFRNPLALNKATLQSTQRQLDTSSPSPLEPTSPLIAGRTNVQVTKEFRVPISLTGKPNVTVEKHKQFNRVVWTYIGVENIDHFKIYIVCSGGRILIDTVHCDTASSEFYYRHYEKDIAVDFRYEIQPVDLSYKGLQKIASRTLKPVDISRSLGLGSISKIVRL
jgi:hypothetical protein